MQAIHREGDHVLPLEDASVEQAVLGEFHTLRWGRQKGQQTPAVTQLALHCMGEVVTAYRAHLAADDRERIWPVPPVPRGA